MNMDKQRSIFDAEIEADMRAKREGAAYDADKTEQRKALGMNDAATKRRELLSLARELAFDHATRHGEVTADDVGRKLIQMGYAADALGPAAGSIFTGKQWIFTGKRVKSKRVSNHARELKVWRLMEKL